MSHPYDLLDIPGLPGKLIFTPYPVPATRRSTRLCAHSSRPAQRR